MSRLAWIALGLAAGLGLSSAANAAHEPDAWITTKVKMALLLAEDVSATAVRVDTTDGKVTKAREELSDAKIAVEVANGVVRLTGKVRSQSDRLTALTLARATDGVRSVVGDLEVKSR